MNNKIVVGITQGDSNSIAYEVMIKALADPRIFDICTPVIYGSSKLFGYYKKFIPDMDTLSTNVINSIADAHPKRINIINTLPDTLAIDPGKQTEDGARGAILSLEAAVKDIKSGLLNVLVTAPFNKSSVNSGDFNFIGHTEYLANEMGVSNPLMFLVSNLLKVGLVTAHLPIKDISSTLTIPLIINKLQLMFDSLKRDFLIVRPKIAVLSLNPHNGDNGLLGKEEIDIINPAIQEFNKNGVYAFGTYSPDGFFAGELLNKFDSVLAIYHDQGLIPFKALAFESGVNFTAGLPIVRTSPDHGTAYELVGQNVAKPDSMIAAIYTACDIYRNRILFDEMNSNPLRTVDRSSNNNAD